MAFTFGTDLTGKVAVVTGAGGVLCGMFAKTIAQAGAKVAVLDLNEKARRKLPGRFRQRAVQRRLTRQMYWNVPA